MGQSKKSAKPSKKRTSVGSKPAPGKPAKAPSPRAPGEARPVARPGKPAASGFHPAPPRTTPPGRSGPADAAKGGGRDRPRSAEKASAGSADPGKAPAPAGAGTPGRKLPKGGPTKAELRAYRAALVARRRALLSSTKDLASGALQGTGGDFSVDHMADHGSDNYEQDFNLKLLEGEAEQLYEIRDALLKIDGLHELPFGLCEACAETDRKACPTCPWIPASRLEVLPHARYCVAIQAREERAR